MEVSLVSRLGFDYLPLDAIDISISNVRKSKLEEGLEQLASSIREIGIQQPVVVFKKGSRFELIIGQRRYLACKKLGINEIPAIITTVSSDTDAVIKSFSENIHRQDLDYRDKMQVAHELLTKLGSVNSAARHLGVSEQTIKNYLGYAAVPDAIKQMVDAGQLGAATAMRIVKNIPNVEKAISIAQRVKETPRNEDRRNIIDMAWENPNETIEAIVQAAQARSKMKRITIHLTPKIYEAITAASKTYQTGKEDVVKEAVLDWLQMKGFMK